MNHSTNLVIISGPSGAGKDSVIDGLAEAGLPIERVITSTTREKRPNETHGKEYYFISENELQKKIDNNEMAEWARVDNNRLYGVTKTELERVKSLKDKIGIWRIEYKGAQAVRKTIPDILTIFIEPPDLGALLERTHERGDSNNKEIQERLEYSKEFLKHKNMYDSVVINEKNKLNKTVDQVVEILKKEGYLDNNA